MGGGGGGVIEPTNQLGCSRVRWRQRPLGNNETMQPPGSMHQAEAEAQAEAETETEIEQDNKPLGNGSVRVQCPLKDRAHTGTRGTRA